MTKQIRKIRREGNIAYVPLTRGYEAIIDVEDLPLVENHNWWSLIARRTVYAVNTNYFGDGKKAYMHRVISAPPQGIDVDHISCNGLDNRRSNLRHATRSQNMRNTQLIKSNKSGFKGVFWDKHRMLWRSEIKHHGKRIFLGRFDKIEDAVAAYEVASESLHGKFRRLH